MISIIIPVYNAQETISKCIDSIMNNNFNKYEIIAINDGSSDNSLKILRDYEKRYPEKIRVFDQENQGVARTRNNGVAYAKGAHVMFIDNDDYVDSDYLEKFQAEIGTKDLDMVIGGYRRTNGEKPCLK
ncbi:MAG: glycosyltransferase family A protein [Candidatus Moraniibacteriota bacterium]